MRTVHRSACIVNLFRCCNGGGCGGGDWPCDEVSYEDTVFSACKRIPTLVMYLLVSTTVVIILDCNSLCIKDGFEQFSVLIRVVKVSKDFCRDHYCEHIHTQMTRNLRIRKRSFKSGCMVACTNNFNFI